MQRKHALTTVAAITAPVILSGLLSLTPDLVLAFLFFFLIDGSVQQILVLLLVLALILPSPGPLTLPF
jgi:hypothetical protein